MDSTHTTGAEQGSARKHHYFVIAFDEDGGYHVLAQYYVHRNKATFTSKAIAMIRDYVLSQQHEWRPFAVLVDEDESGVYQL